jgi:hypothetical protein
VDQGWTSKASDPLTARPQMSGDDPRPSRVRARISLKPIYGTGFEGFAAYSRPF